MDLKYKELSDYAYELHTNKKFNEAEKIYIDLLQIRPDDVNILNLYGLLCISKSNYKKAVTLLSKALVIKKSEYIAANLAKAYFLAKNVEKAIKMYELALTYGKNDDIYYSMALAYKAKGNIKEVISCYEKAIELNPNNYKAFYNMALAYKSKNDVDNAVLAAERAAKINENDEDVQVLLSKCYEERGYYSIAVKALEKAVSVNGNNYLYYYNLGVLCSRLNETEKAIENYRKALIVNPKHVESYLNISEIFRQNDKNLCLNYLLKALEIKPDAGNVKLAMAQVYRELLDNESAIKVLDEILKLNPKQSDAYFELGINYMDMCEYDKALNYYSRALSIQPYNLSYIHGKAVAFKYLGYYNEAKDMLEYVVSKDDSDVKSSITLGMMYLQEKDFNKGMKLYSLRSKDTKFASTFSNKIWDKDVDVKDKKILVYSDCGLGDTIMCARFLKKLTKLSENITLQTDKELVSILSDNFKEINVIPKSAKRPDYDVVIPIMDLQYLLDLDFNHIPYAKKYLNVESKYVKKFANLFKSTNKKIGICYRGNKKIFKNRFIPFDEIKELFSANNCTFYSFQIEKDAETDLNLINLKEYINDYKDTAAMLKNLDLLITIDSSIAHMAGALGVKTFLLLPKVAEWRWFDDTETTPWYESIKIFRQEKSADWTDVINAVKNELEQLDE